MLIRKSTETRDFGQDTIHASFGKLNEEHANSINVHPELDSVTADHVAAILIQVAMKCEKERRLRFVH